MLLRDWDWREVAVKIARAAREVLGEDARVYVFGSAVKGETTAASDLDVAVVVEDGGCVDPGKAAAEILDRAGVDPFAPVHLHVVTREAFERDPPDAYVEVRPDGTLREHGEPETPGRSASVVRALWRSGLALLEAAEGLPPLAGLAAAREGMRLCLRAASLALAGSPSKDPKDLPGSAARGAKEVLRRLERRLKVAREGEEPSLEELSEHLDECLKAVRALARNLPVELPAGGEEMSVDVEEMVRMAKWKLSEAKRALREGLGSLAVAEAHQALELLIKATLRELDVKPPRTHDLRQLLGVLAMKLLDMGEGDLAVEVRRIAREHRDALASLLEGYFSRFEPPFEGDAEEAVKKAEEVFEDLRRVLDEVRAAVEE